MRLGQMIFAAMQKQWGQMINKKEEIGMENQKPRICEVLGVEVGEVWSFDTDVTKYRINDNGHREYYCHGKWHNSCSEYDLCDTINNPNLIVHSFCWTKQEIERAKAIKSIFPKARTINYHAGHIEICDKECAIVFIETDLFPSLRDGQSVKLGEIICSCDD